MAIRTWDQDPSIRTILNDKQLAIGYWLLAIPV